MNKLHDTDYKLNLPRVAVLPVHLACSAAELKVPAGDDILVIDSRGFLVILFSRPSQVSTGPHERKCTPFGRHVLKGIIHRVIVVRVSF